MTNKVNDFKNMQGELLAALDILDDYQYEGQQVSSESQTGLVISEADSLLARCEQVVKQHENSAKPKMRVIHHFACSGGTLISKCIAALPNVYLLSEVHPATHNHMGGGKPKFLPSDITTLSRYAGIPNIGHLADKIFKQNVVATNKHVVENGGLLVLRDHSHSDFCVGSRVAEDSKVVSTLSDEFEILRIVTIRHPVDAYLSLVKNNWEQHTPKGFEEYCKRFLLFIDNYKKKQIFKYEDVVKNPVRSIKKIAKKLDLPFSDSFIDTFSTMQVTGDSGRSGAVIEERPRRPLSDEQVAMINSSKSFKKIAKKFNYGIPGEVE